MATRLSRRILLLGWDAADWQVILPLVRAGQMPALGRLMQNGVSGDLQTLVPMISPLLWNSIATGVRADKHGILNFIEPDPHGPGIRPVGSSSRRVKALWNILSQSGLRTHVVGWFASHPAEPINGICVSNMFGVPSAQRHQPWSTPAGSVHPRSREQTLAALRIHPDDITPAQVQSFVPRLADIDPADPHLTVIKTALAECTTTQRIVSWILQNESWDFVAAYYNAIDHASHDFMIYHPPKHPDVPARDFELYQNVIAGFYRYHDQMLDELLQRSGPETTVMVLSDHGFQSGAFRPRLPEHAPSQWHRAMGILTMAGGGIRVGGGLGKAGLLDIAPTVLTLLGLPVGEDMAGRPLLEGLADPVTPERIPSWEHIAGDAGCTPLEHESDAWQSQAVFQQLIDLGYLPALDPEDASSLRFARLRDKLHLALVYLSSDRLDLAATLLEELVREEPDDLGYMLHLARCRLGQKRLNESWRLAECILERNPRDAEAALTLGQVAFVEGRADEALVHLRRAEAIHPHQPEIQHQLAATYLLLQRWAEAEQAMHRALTVGVDPAREYVGLAQVCLVQRRHAEALRWADQASQLEPQLPRAHYLRGVALLFLRRMAEGQQALEHCIALDPQCAEAYDQLAEVHEHVTGDRKRAAEMRRRAMELSSRVETVKESQA
jgi:predicted AlkP superfamily phosphohydrolase/phosphomutase/tetratricopeptide (TPR) repeat protein